MNTRRVSIKDIAAEAGSSIALVSFVMNNRASGQNKYRVNKDTARRILEVADRLGYQPNNAARALRCGKTNTIGVIVSDISNKFFADIARCIEDRAHQRNYTVLFGSTDENTDKLDNLINVFQNKGIDGLIIAPSENSEESIKRVSALQIPMVLLDRELPGVETNSVLLDNLKGGAQITEALLARGCRHIEMISYSMRLSNIIDRETGFKLCMEKAGLASEGMIYRIRHDRFDTISQVIIDAKERGVEGLLFATNSLALSGLRVISRNGWKIPEDFAVATFDGNDAFEINNLEIAYIQQPIAQFGTEAVDLLLKNVELKTGTLSPTRIILSPKLILNG